MAAAFLLRCAFLAPALVLAACGDGLGSPDGDETAASASLPSDTPVASQAASVSSTRGPDSDGPLPTDCNVAEAEGFVGQRASPEVRSRLAAAVAPVNTIRWVGPGDATTEDYSPQRLNVMLDVGAEIVSVHCG